MSTSHEKLLSAAISSVIDSARDAGTPRKAFACAGDTCAETVRRWEGGQLPSLWSFVNLIDRRNHLPDSVRRQLLDAMLRDSGWKAVACEPAEAEDLDACGDGKVDGRDTLLHAIRASAGVGKVMEMLADAVRDGTLSDSEKSEVRPVLYGIREAVERAVQTLDFSKGLRVAQ